MGKEKLELLINKKLDNLLIQLTKFLPEAAKLYML